MDVAEKTSEAAKTTETEEKKSEDATEVEDEDKLPDDLRTLTAYPEPLMTDEQVRQGGFFLYIIGKFL